MRDVKWEGVCDKGNEQVIAPGDKGEVRRGGLHVRGMCLEGMMNPE